mmetsp:Transcript_9928/g.15981  ORF Transcript_9928/g.15981 Transcript_9928/m.15981 type:complete len:229 (-) Transcript_9928:73-759(-)
MAFSFDSMDFCAYVSFSCINEVFCWRSSICCLSFPASEWRCSIERFSCSIMSSLQSNSVLSLSMSCLPSITTVFRLLICCISRSFSSRRLAVCDFASLSSFTRDIFSASILAFSSAIFPFSSVTFAKAFCSPVNLCIVFSRSFNNSIAFCFPCLLRASNLRNCSSRFFPSALCLFLNASSSSLKARLALFLTASISSLKARLALTRSLMCAVSSCFFWLSSSVSKERI